MYSHKHRSFYSFFNLTQTSVKLIISFFCMYDDFSSAAFDALNLIIIKNHIFQFVCKADIISFFPDDPQSAHNHIVRSIRIDRFHQILKRLHVECFLHHLTMICHKNDHCISILSSDMFCQFQSAQLLHLNVKNIQCIWHISFLKQFFGRHEAFTFSCHPCYF